MSLLEDLTDDESIDASLVTLENIESMTDLLVDLADTTEDPARLHQAVDALAHTVHNLAEAVRVALAIPAPDQPVA